MEQTLSPAEKRACKVLLKENHPAYEQPDTDEESLLTPEASSEDSGAENGDTVGNEFNLGELIDTDWKEQMDEIERDDSDYVDTTFILSSAAVAESLWSKQDALVDQRRSRMSPSMTEAILFLKENRDLWGMEQVREALIRVKANAKSERTKKKMLAHQEEEREITVESLALGLSGLNVDYSSE